MPNCKLCLENEADQTNSHIISKFLSKRLYDKIGHKRLIEISKKGNTKFQQDTAKESFILCKGCERRIGLLETIMSKVVISINNFINLKDKFEIVEIGNNKIMECLNINPINFKVFVYTLVWRSSISNLPSFENFKLDQKTESTLRTFLNETLKNNNADLIKSLAEIKNIPNYDYCIFKPSVLNDYSRGIFTACRMTESHYRIFTVDFIFLFISNSTNMHPALKLVSNFQNDKLLIKILDINQWNNDIKTIVFKVIK